jgi:hypothetical protein
MLLKLNELNAYNHILPIFTIRGENYHEEGRIKIEQTQIFLLIKTIKNANVFYYSTKFSIQTKRQIQNISHVLLNEKILYIREKDLIPL